MPSGLGRQVGLLLLLWRDQDQLTQGHSHRCVYLLLQLLIQQKGELWGGGRPPWWHGGRVSSPRLQVAGLLTQRGYQQYEISNFALPGFECRHNLGYWRQIPYLGLGAAASSMLPDASGRCSYLRVTNPAGLEAYISMINGHNDARETVEVSARDARFETIMLGLRTTQGVSEAAFQQMHGRTMDACWGKTLRRLAADGLLIHDDGCWRMTRRGMDVQNAILVELMDEEPAP